MMQQDQHPIDICTEIVKISIVNIILWKYYPVTIVLYNFQQSHWSSSAGL